MVHYFLQFHPDSLDYFYPFVMIIILFNLTFKLKIYCFPLVFFLTLILLIATFYFKGSVCFSESGFGKPLSKLSCVCLPFWKLINKKHFPVKEKFGLVSRKVFFFYFGRKTLSGSCEKFRNVILFADYIKFGPQTFDCYIYIYFFEYLFFNFIP
jgi:hypothetical protein